MDVYRASGDRYDTMQYRRCGRSGLMLPMISLGLWHNFGGVDSQDNARAMLVRAFDLGITHFDLANNYGPPPGSAETNFGEVFRQNCARGPAKSWAASTRSARSGGIASCRNGYPRRGTRPFSLSPNLSGAFERPDIAFH